MSAVLKAPKINHGINRFYAGLGRKHQNEILVPWKVELIRDDVLGRFVQGINPDPGY
jgi:hypothetical protein